MERDAIRQKKESVNTEELLANCPMEFGKIMTHLKTLRYGIKPDYKKLSDLLENLAKRERHRYSDPYDWESSSPYFRHFRFVTCLPPPISLLLTCRFAR